MKKEIKQLIQEYEEELEGAINSDRIKKWEDLGFGEIPEKQGQIPYESPTEWLRENGEFDEGEQTRIVLYEEFLDKLRKLLEKS